MILTTSFHDINQKLKKKTLFIKLQLFPISFLPVMHGYVHWHSSIDYCVKLSLVDNEFLQKNGCHFIRKWFLLESFGEMCFLEESYKKVQTIHILKFLRMPSISIWELVMAICHELATLSVASPVWRILLPVKFRVRISLQLLILT